MHKAQLRACAEAQKVREQTSPLSTIALHKILPQAREISLFVFFGIGPI